MDIKRPAPYHENRNRHQGQRRVRWIHGQGQPHNCDPVQEYKRSPKEKARALTNWKRSNAGRRVARARRKRPLKLKSGETIREEHAALKAAQRDRRSHAG